MKSARLTAFVAILRKDLVLLSRDTIFLVLTVAAITIFVVLYYVLPAEVDEGFVLGAHGPGIEDTLTKLAFDDAGSDPENPDEAPVRFYGTAVALQSAVEAGEVEMGIDFPPDLVTSIELGQAVDVTVYSRPSLPPEYAATVSTIVREVVYAIAGHPLPVSEPEEETVILGPEQGPLPFREQLRSLYAFLVLVMESIALSALIASEVQNRTMTALLSTPARVGDVLASKGLLGASVAFSEAALVLLLVRGFGARPVPVLVALALGSMLVTGLAMIAGSAGKDLLGTMQIGLFLLVPLIIPAFAVIVPGTVAPWIRVLPSYGLVQIVIDASRYGAPWSVLLPNMAVLGSWSMFVALIGYFTLRRRVELI